MKYIVIFADPVPGDPAQVRRGSGRAPGTAPEGPGAPPRPRARTCASRAPGARPGRPSATHRRSPSPGPHPSEADGAPAPGPANPWLILIDAEWERKSRAEITADPGLSTEVFPQNPCGADTSTKMAATPKPARPQLRGRGSLKEPISVPQAA